MSFLYQNADLKILLWSGIILQTENSVFPFMSNAALKRCCYLILIFFAGCLAGWLYEEIFYWITEGVLRDRGILYGPWLPIYGMGALAIYAMKPLKKNPLLLFLLCIGTTGVLEYALGYIGINYFGLRLWDYRGLFLNLNGIICFRSVMSFGIMGMFFHYVLEPYGEELYNKLSLKTVCAICFALLLMFGADCIFSSFFHTPITY